MARNIGSASIDHALIPHPTESAQKLTVSTSEVQFTAWAETVEAVLWSLEGADVRWTTDGVTPVAGTTGIKLVDGDTGMFGLRTANAAKFVRNAAADATIHAYPFSKR